MKPKIGEPRLYEGTVQALYPGEQAHAIVPADDIESAVRQARRLGALALQVDSQRLQWFVEPTPGWRGWWLRTRYRCWGRFVSGVPGELQAAPRGRRN
jgi:hypothetical protein